MMKEALISTPRIDLNGGGNATVGVLEDLTDALNNALAAISVTREPNIQGGVNFYDEVRRFEIGLIQQALMLTNGHQQRAARLLNLKATTLNAKIKTYRIRCRCRISLAR